MAHSLSLLDLADALGLGIVDARAEEAPLLPRQLGEDDFPSLVGHLSLTHPHQIQIVGPSEIDWLEQLGASERARVLADLAAGAPCGLVITDAAEIPASLRELARQRSIPILRTDETSHRIIGRLRHMLGRQLAARTTYHGVFLDVLGTGVLLTGDPAIGKSELALELVSRGHSLVADDSPEFRRPAPDIVDGEAPEMIKDFLEVRGLGVLNIRAMYGDAAIRHRKQLQLIIRLQDLEATAGETIDRLSGSRHETEILGLTIATTVLPVAPGRNLAVLVEAAVRDHLLRRRGYDAGADLTERQAARIRADAP